jgi:hypothetical protein
VDLRDAVLIAMRTWRTRRISRKSASRLIAGGSPGPAEYRGLRTLLDAATAPPAPGELAGEQDAVAGFVTAHRASSPGRPEHPYARGTVRALGVKIAAVAGALAVSGTAIAATTGHLPDAAQRRAHDYLGAPDAPAPAVPAPGPSATRAATMSAPSGSPAPPARSVAPAATASAAGPPPSLTDLCRRWLTPPGGPRAVTESGHRALRAAAGSEKNIGPYCTGLLHPSTPAAAAITPAGAPPSPPAPATPAPLPPTPEDGHAGNGLPPAPPTLGAPDPDDPTDDPVT